MNLFEVLRDAQVAIHVERKKVYLKIGCKSQKVMGGFWNTQCDHFSFYNIKLDTFSKNLYIYLLYNKDTGCAFCLNDLLMIGILYLWFLYKPKKVKSSLEY